MVKVFLATISIKDDPMRVSRIVFSCRLALFAAVAAMTFMTTNCSAQLKGVDSSLSRKMADLTDQVAAQSKPYKVSSRFHLMEGTTSGYLVVQVELPPGSYMYSLNQTGAINPTKIKVVQSDGFMVDGKFNPDRPAEVIENDPVFNQRVEKHKGKVQFFAPVKFDSPEAAGKVQPEIILNGQVCSTGGVCLPIRDKRVKAEFGGSFGRSVEATTPDTPRLR